MFVPCLEEPTASNGDDNRLSESGTSDSMEVYLALMDFIYKFAGEADTADAALGLLSELEGLNLRPGLLDENETLKAHLDRALLIAERVSHQLSREDEVHPLDNNRLLLSLDYRVMAAGAEALRTISPLCENLSLGARLSLRDQNLDEKLTNALTEVREVSGRSRIFTFSSQGAEQQLVGVLSRTPKHNQLSIFLIQLSGQDGLGGLSASSLGLTAAETELVRWMQMGRSLKDAASELGIAHNTARNHLKSIFGKLGVNRQTDLVRLLTMLSVALPSQIERDQTLQAENDFDVLQGIRSASAVSLSDGNTWSYFLYGPAVGKPILVFNSQLNHFLISEKMNEDLYRKNICLIVPQQAGYSLSSPQRNYSFEKYRQDAEEFLSVIRHRFNTEKFPVVGFVGGARFAIEAMIACPTSFSTGILVSPRVSPQTGDMQGLGSRLLRQFSESEWALSFVGKILATKATEVFVRKFIEKWMASSPVDAQLLASDEDMRECLILGTKMLFTENYDAIAQSLRMMIKQPAVEWEKVTTPLTIWHGKMDGLNALENSRNIADKLSGAKLNVLPEVGQLLGSAGISELWSTLILQEQSL